MFDKIAAISALIAVVKGQAAGTFQQEVHPKLTWSECTSAGCSTQQGSVVVDANWRWTHNSQGTNCYTGNTWDTTYCPNNQAGAQNCVLDGANYQGTYGVTTSGNALTLKFVTQSQGKNIGSRLYLLDSSDKLYQGFSLLGKEFTFDVDVSQLGCGLNGALYFTSMDLDGGLSKYPTNTAGPSYGTGYCDSQCPRDLKFINGQANCEGWQPSSTDINSGVGDNGSCCSEMDVWEANSISNALTPHPCDTVGQKICSGDNCGGTYSADRYAGECDPDGCDYNPFRNGDPNFYGPGKTVDTKKPITVVTQFVKAGSSVQIKRFYIQNGVSIAQPSVTNMNGYSGNVIEDNYCTTEAATFGGSSFNNHGGLSQMSKALNSPMVLVMSLWDDHKAGMEWLDSTYPDNSTASDPGAARGTCAQGSGDPNTVENQQANAQVVYSNIRFGDIGTTTGNTAAPAPGSSSNAPPPATSTHTSSTPAAPPASSTKCTSPPPASSTPPSGGNGSAQAHWGQCGGIGWTGPTTCVSPYTCQAQNEYYSQCL